MLTQRFWLTAGGLVLLLALFASLYLLIATPRGTKSSSSIQSGPPVSYRYNTLGQVQKIIYSDGTAYVYAYDTHGDKVSETNPSGKHWLYIYDQHQHLLSVIAPDGHVTSSDISHQ